MSDDANAMMGAAFRAAPPAARDAMAAARQRIAGLNPGQRAAAARQAEILAAVGQGLGGRPYGERRALLAHLAPQLAAAGVPAAAVAGFDPTDDNLAAAVGQAAAVRGLLGETS
jgi:hypothetical protein